jgi:hypothetical protein
MAGVDSLGDAVGAAYYEVLPVGLEARLFRMAHGVPALARRGAGS